MENNYERVFNEVYKWQRETFPNSNEISKLHHLKEEIEELLIELNKPNRDWKKIRREYADCYFLLNGSAACSGFSAKDVVEIQVGKLIINKEREWEAPDEKGVVRHKK